MKILTQQELEQLNQKDRQEYEARLKYYRDYYNTLDTAKKEGIEEGERNKAIETARKSLQKGYSVEDIADITGLSIAEIEELKKTLES